jgi:CRP/FNR family transcriptional regulator, cyclic AMP receptor protein
VTPATRTPAAPRAPAAAGPSAIGLKSIRLFDGLSPDALEELAARCRWRRYSAGQRIISRDAPDHDVYFVAAGKVQVIAFSASGKQVTYGEIRAGESFGDFAAIDGQTRSADVVALEETLVASMDRATFRRLLHEHPAACDRMLSRLVGRVRELTERVFEFSTLGVQNRLHAELLRLARLAGVNGNTARIDPAPKHGDIAGQISTYREQVTRELSAMAKQGLVQRDGHALVIPDVARLEKLVAEVRLSA